MGQENDFDLEELLIARKILTKIMKQNKLNYNNAFVHVRNYITNMYCDIVCKQTEKSTTPT